MKTTTRGIHHVTAITRHPQRNIDFYSGVLGLRLVKKTVNFDDPGSYHFYFGDATGTPGTIMTFFAWPNGGNGSLGSGQATATALSIPPGSIDFWSKRLAALGAAPQPVTERFGAPVMGFRDPDGLRLELVATSAGDSDEVVDADAGAAPIEPRPASEDPVPEAHALRGFHSVTLSVRRPGRTRRVLVELMGLEQEAEEGDRIRLVAGLSDLPGRRVDLRHTPDEATGEVAVGTVHHVAFRAEDDAVELAMRETLLEGGQRVTDVRERNYFRSVYFREPNGVLFEIATDGPGFAVDEPLDELGSSLKLPDWLESRRAEIEASLPAVAVPI